MGTNLCQLGCTRVGDRDVADFGPGREASVELEPTYCRGAGGDVVSALQLALTRQLVPVESGAGAVPALAKVDGDLRHQDAARINAFSVTTHRVARNAGGRWSHETAQHLVYRDSVQRFAVVLPPKRLRASACSTCRTRAWPSISRAAAILRMTKSVGWLSPRSMQPQ